MTAREKLTVSTAIIPLVRINGSGETLSGFSDLIGTGFLIGSRGYGLTCGHVIDQLYLGLKDSQSVASVRNTEQGVKAFEIVEFEEHPTQDIAIFRLNNSDIKSWLRIEEGVSTISEEYQAWGYPRENIEELKKLDPEANINLSLIYTQGYIRRLIDNELPISVFRGDSFYEISDLGGSGYSGSPIIDKNSFDRLPWEVIGVYMGEKNGVGSPVGYAVKSAAFWGWKPNILDCSIGSESSGKDVEDRSSTVTPVL